MNTHTAKEDNLIKVKIVDEKTALEVNKYGKEPEKYLVIKAAGTMMDTSPTTNQDWLNWEAIEIRLKKFTITKNKLQKKLVKDKEYNAQLLNKTEIEIMSH